MALQEVRVPVQEVKVPVQEVKVPVQEVKVPVQEVKVPVQEVRVPVQEVGVPVQEVGVPVQEVGVPVQEVGVPVQEVWEGVWRCEVVLHTAPGGALRAEGRPRGARPGAPRSGRGSTRRRASRRGLAVLLTGPPWRAHSLSSLPTRLSVKNAPMYLKCGRTCMSTLYQPALPATSVTVICALRSGRRPRMVAETTS
jgi:hypothetical protein